MLGAEGSRTDNKGERAERPRAAALGALADGHAAHTKAVQLIVVVLRVDAARVEVQVVSVRGRRIGRGRPIVAVRAHVLERRITIIVVASGVEILSFYFGCGFWPLPGPLGVILLTRVSPFEGMPVLGCRLNGAYDPSEGPLIVAANPWA